MRCPAFIPLLLPALLAGQAPLLDEGRLDPAWFGPAAEFQPSKALGLQWLKPGLNLHHRSLRLRPWEPAVWRQGRRATKDELLVARIEKTLPADIAQGLRRGLKQAMPVGPSGDVLVVGRIVDAIGMGDDALAFSTATLSFDLKLVDGDTGELLGAFHDTFRTPDADAMRPQLIRWFEDLGKLLATLAVPVSGAAVPVAPAPAASAAPAFDLEGALRRIEGLKRDGLLSEEECRVLRQKAADRSKTL